MKNIDFLIIGAQKSGTTSLFKYLVEHPAIYIPQEKELPYFSYDELHENGMLRFLEQYFAKANDSQQWGTVTPQYMYDPIVPDRISAELPKVKLIALLRDPVERAISHYKMTVRRGDEKRPVDVAFRECLEDDQAAKARVLRGRSKDEVSCYLVWGEYGRILEKYFELFPAEQILILDHGELAIEPAILVRKIFDFLRVDADFLPNNLDKKFHIGGSKVRTRLHERVRRIQIIRWAWRQLSCGMQYRIASIYERLNTVVGKSDAFEKPSAETMEALSAFYAEDLKRLDQLKEKYPSSFFSVSTIKADWGK